MIYLILPERILPEERPGIRPAGNSYQPATRQGRGDGAWTILRARLQTVQPDENLLLFDSSML
ncbi:hypothetical protein [Hoeflea sp. AS16]|uniref:hypothetical protein n=1 Tax=Hoeflea sp. AS16 TaxID=3135779 RepID=UPI00316D57EF